MLVYWIWYATLPDLKDGEKAALLQHFRDPEDIYFASAETLAEIEDLTEEGIKALQQRDMTQAEQILRDCENGRIKVITYADRFYPESLRSIADPPMVLYCKGKLPDFQRAPLIGVVGTRKASLYGLSSAKRLGFQIARCGGVVVSGGADGIDTMALEGALSGGGIVVAVFAGGVDTVYPTSNRKLFESIQHHGCLISDYPPGTPPLKWHFPIRNRIISGMSRGVLVVEAPKKSGALITAHHALDQGRDVFVVTGNIGVDSCAGSNDLLRSGAIYAESGWDVVGEYASEYPDTVHQDKMPVQEVLRQEELEKPLEKVAEKTTLPRKIKNSIHKKDKKVIDNEAKPTYSDIHDKLDSLTPEERQVFQTLSGECLVDDLIAQSGLSSGVVLACLTLLEVKGLIQRLPGRRVRPKIAKP